MEEESSMAKLTTKKRDKLKGKMFGLPKERKYPMPDKRHAINAKARATQMENKGLLSQNEKKKIDQKANRIIRKLKTRSSDSSI